jgi:hypothetical protein
VLSKEETRRMLGTLGYEARQLDVRAIKQFALPTLKPQFKEPADEPE